MLIREEKRLITKMINGKIEINQSLVKKAIQVERKKIYNFNETIEDAKIRQSNLTGFELMSQDMNPVLRIEKNCRAGIKSSKRRLETLGKLVT